MRSVLHSDELIVDESACDLVFVDVAYIVNSMDDGNNWMYVAR